MQLALPLAATQAERVVACSWVQSTPDLELPASTPCVVARGFDVLRDGIGRDSMPAGDVVPLGVVRSGAVVWIERGARWCAVEVW